MTLLLLDGYNLLYRSFTSLPSAIVARDGRPINAVYGLVSTILRLHRELSPRHIVAAFDDPATPTFRHRMYAGYQAHRGPLGGDNAQDFARQVALAREVLPLHGIPTPAAAGYEADDILATLAMEASVGGLPSVIVSTDRDLLQLIRPNIEIVALGTPPRWTRVSSDVVDRLGVQPHQVPDFKALAGDPSDNIPGVRGIGAKTAAALLSSWGDLHGVFAHLDVIPGRTAEKLRLQRDEAFLYLQVATLVTDVPLPVSVATLPPPQIWPDSKVRDMIEGR